MGDAIVLKFSRMWSSLFVMDLNLLPLFLIGPVIFMTFGEAFNRLKARLICTEEWNRLSEIRTLSQCYHFT